MKSISLSTVVSVFLLASMIASVSAQGYPPETIIVTAPAISGNSIIGVLALTYPDGTKAVLNPPFMTVSLCGAKCWTTTTTATTTTTTATTTATKSCTTEVVSINADGSYSIPIPQGMTGTIMVYIVGGSIKDKFGALFPSVDTLLGTVTVAGCSPPPPGSPPAASSYLPNLFRVAGVAAQDSAQVAVYAVGAMLLVLAVVGAVMLIAPRRNKN